MMKRASHTRFFAVVAFVASWLLAVGTAGAQSNSQGPGTLAPRGGAAPAGTITRSLAIGALFEAASPGAAATCDSAGCTAYAPIYTETVNCPRPAGATCTFQVTIHAQVNAGSNDSTFGEEGVYQFLVDGGPHTGSGGQGLCLLHVERVEPPIFTADSRRLLRSDRDRNRRYQQPGALNRREHWLQ